MTTEKCYSNATPAPKVGFATTTQGGSVNEVQRVGYTGTMIMVGAFTLTHDGETTSSIAYNAKGLENGAGQTCPFLFPSQ